MGFAEMVVTIVFISYAGNALTEWVKAQGKRHGGASTAEVEHLRAEVGALREEMTALRRVKGGSGAAAPDVLSRLDRIQDEVAGLRDTTTQFDMSFDAALDRLERRMDRADNEREVSVYKNGPSSTTTTTQQVGAGRG